MIASIPVSRMYEAMRQTLELHWLSGKQGGERLLASDTVQKPSLALVGHLNFVHPNRVQVLGCAEMDYLRSLDKEALAQAIRSLFSTELAAIIVANGEPVPPDLLATSTTSQTPLFTSPQPSPQLMPVLSHYLTQVLAESTSVHGVMLEVIGIGVMITGDAAVGKSELALELITRGHRLIADDMVDMYKVAPETLETHCPPLLQDFLEVRGLGILNIRTLFGDTAVKLQKNLKLIVHLKAPEEDGSESISRLDMHASSEVILGVTVPKVRIPVAAGRNLAVLVEVAARNHILRMRGINSAEQFVTRQQQFMDDNP